MRFDLGGQTYQAKYWEKSDGVIGSVFAFDTETDLIEEGKVPPFVIGQAYAGGGTVYLIRLEELGDFFEAHREATWVMHNAPFDASVLEHEINVSCDEIVRCKRLFDVGLMYQLLKLADKGQVPGKWSLDIMAAELCGLQIEKDDKLRCGFGKYRDGSHVAYDKMSDEEIRYACVDAVATFLCFEKLNLRVTQLDAKLQLSHKIQLMGAIGLHQVSLNGIGFDLKEKDGFLESIDQEIIDNKGVLAKWGYIPGRAGVTDAFESVIRNLGIQLPVTPTGKISQKSEDLELYRDHSFVNAFLSYKENTKLKSFVENLSRPRIHTHFRTLVNTGRTSSFDPNIQNLPRRPGIRECFIPAPGSCFLIIDYSQLELCTLAQVCFDRFGQSKMGDLINGGKDLHRWFASAITGKAEKEITKYERQNAKACNFGFPGGLGIKTFIEYAKNTYGITDLAEEKARELKEKWLDSFPEMRLYLRDTLFDNVDFSSLEWCDNREIAAALFKRILSGEITSKKTGRRYAYETINWAFNQILPQIFSESVATNQGSIALQKKVLRETVSVKTGRIRANATYCQAKNTPFQGMAADGAKIALYRLIRAGFRVVAFIHDEFIIEVPMSLELAAVGMEVERILIEAMKCVVPDVTIKAEWSVTDRWYKEHKLVRNAEGRVQVFSRSVGAQNRELEDVVGSPSSLQLSYPI